MATAESKAGRLSAAALILFVVLAVWLFRMQVVKGDYYRALSEKNRLRLIYLEAPRGRILDRHGEALADSRLSFNCTAVLQEPKAKIGKSIEHLAPILEIDPEDLLERYRKKKAGVYNTVVLAEDIPAAKAMAIEERLAEMPGLMIETRPIRQYPLKDAAAHVTGFIGPQTAGENEELEFSGYRPSDWLGRDGLERSYESYLRGHSGGLQLEVNSRGQYVQVLGVQEPSDGRDIRLSLDAGLQGAVQKLLGDRRGAVAVMELEKGGVLSLNSAPSFDPNLFASTQGRRDVGKYIEGEHSPMLDRVIQGQYPPGSVYKIITGLAALESKRINAATEYRCPGFALMGKQVFRCWSEKGHGPQDLSQAYAHSCDVFFYLTGLAVGADAIQRKSLEFGLSQLTGVDLPGERKGLVPSREWKKKTLKSPWYDGDTLNLSIGQGYLQVTPIQALAMTAAVATGGQKLKPHLVEKIGAQSVAERYVSHVEISASALKAVKRGLDEVVNSDTGTGRLSRIPGVRVAGKTGTAETGKKGGQTHAWFVGYAPSDKPKIALVVFLELGGHGGVEAATVAQGVLAELKERGYL